MWINNGLREMSECVKMFDYIKIIANYCVEKQSRGIVYEDFEVKNKDSNFDDDYEERKKVTRRVMYYCQRMTRT